MVDPDEECDDANSATDDGCLPTCRGNRCGDGFLWPAREYCDDGNEVDSDGCTSRCRWARCGDGIIEIGAEICDDANELDGDDCPADCGRTGLADASTGESDGVASEDSSSCGSTGEDCYEESGGGTTSAAITPEVLAILPADGTGGISANDTIVITFSTQMNLQDTVGAISLTSHSASELTFSWNSDATELTVRPAALEYAEGSSSEATVANEYTLTIGANARDVGGIPLGLPVSTRFSTLRRISRDLDATYVSTYDTYGHVSGLANPQLCTSLGDVDLQVGRNVWSSGSTRYYTFVDYHSDSLGDDEILEFESVVFESSQLAPDAGFYPDGFVTLQMLESGDINRPSVMDLDVTQELGVLALSAVAVPSLDVTEVFEDAGTESPSSYVFRLSFGGDPDNDAYARFDCSGFSLAIVYLTP